MKFPEFVEISTFIPTYAANCILYKPESRAAKLARNIGFKPTKEELTKMRYLVSGKKTFNELFTAKAASTNNDTIVTS